MTTYQGYACIPGADLPNGPQAVSAVAAAGILTCAATCYGLRATATAVLTPWGVS